MLASLLATIAAACAGPCAAASARRERALMAQAAAAVAAPVVDLHAHPGAFTRRATGELPASIGAEMAAGGVDAAFFCAVGDGPVIGRERDGLRQVREPTPGELWRSTRGQLERVRRRAADGTVRLLLRPGDVLAARRDGRPAALLAVEGGDPLEGDPGRVSELFEIGVRSIQLVHYRINELGDIQTEAPRHGGLTARGHAVVETMNRLGMVVDAAHAAPATLRAILAASRAPVLVSHTGPAALRPVRRHLDDELLRAIAARGGLVGVWPMSPRPRGLGGFLDALEHVRRVAGVQHVGVATDLAGLAGFTAIATYPDFAPVPAALLARGWPDADVAAVLGGNAVRLLAAVTGAARG